MSTGGFVLSLVLTEGERSKDSHSRRWRVRITGQKVTYHGPYGKCVRGNCSHKEVGFSISAGQFQQLLALIKKESLIRSFKEMRKTEFLGNHVVLTLEITHKGRTGKIRMAGMVGSWVPRGKKHKLSTKAVQFLEKVGNLRRLLTSFARPHLPNAH